MVFGFLIGCVKPFIESKSNGNFHFTAFFSLVAMKFHVIGLSSRLIRFEILLFFHVCIMYTWYVLCSSFGIVEENLFNQILFSLHNAVWCLGVNFILSKTPNKVFSILFKSFRNYFYGILIRIADADPCRTGPI